MEAWEDVEEDDGGEPDQDWVVVTVWVLDEEIDDDDDDDGVARMSLKRTKKTKQLTDGDVEMMMSLRFGCYGCYCFQLSEQLAS